MHLIFDLDGTLINSLPGIANSLNSSLEENNLETYSIATVREFIGDGSRALCEKAAPEGADVSIVDAIEEGFKKYYTQLWQEGTSIYDGMLEVLASIPGQHHVSILSNKPHAFTTEIVTTLFPKNTFHTILGQREGIAKKPDPKGIHEIINGSNHSDKTAVLIGDSTVDLTTANNAGIQSIAVTWGFEDLAELEPCNPTHVVNTAAELNTLIQSL